MQKNSLIFTLTILFFLTNQLIAQTSSEKGNYDYAIMSFKEIGKDSRKIMVLYNNGQRIDFGSQKGINIKPMMNLMNDEEAYLKAIQAMNDDGYELVTSSIAQEKMSDTRYFIVCVFRKPK